MDQAKAPQSGFTNEQLASWGLLRQVRREALMDEHMQSIAQPSAAQLEPLLQQWCQQQRMQTPQELERWQQQHGLDAKQWEQHFVARRGRWLRWCGQTPRREAQQPLPRAQKRSMGDLLLLRVKNEPLARELHLRIKEGEASFEEIAGEFSEGPERQQGGRLGPVPLSQPIQCCSQVA